MTTFAHEFLNFVDSVDLANDDIKEKLWKKAFEYLKARFNVVQMELREPFPYFRESITKSVPGLQTSSTWEAFGAIDKGASRPLKNDDNKYTSLTAYSFGEAKNLWMVSSDRSPLKDNSKDLVDLLTGKHLGIPYWQNNSSRILTEIIYPIKDKSGTAIRVLTMESELLLEPESEVKADFDIIYRAVSRFFWLFRSFEESKKGTEDALQRLEAKSNGIQPYKKRSRLPAITFVHPTPGNTLPEVIEGITSWLQEQRESRRVAECNDALSQLGVFYVTAFVGEKYTVDPNVIFQAGQFASTATNLRSAKMIILTEEASRTELDFLKPHMTVVPRRDGELTRDALRSQLEKFLEHATKVVEG